MVLRGIDPYPFINGWTSPSSQPLSGTWDAPPSRTWSTLFGKHVEIWKIPWVVRWDDHGHTQSSQVHPHQVAGATIQFLWKDNVCQNNMSPKKSFENISFIILMLMFASPDSTSHIERTPLRVMSAALPGRLWRNWPFAKLCPHIWISDLRALFLIWIDWGTGHYDKTAYTWICS